MPSPQKNEPNNDFIQRCMTSEESNRSFPKTDQRVAFCHSQWKNESTSKHILNRAEQLSADETGAASKYKCPYDDLDTVWTGKTTVMLSKIFYFMRCPNGHETRSKSPN